MKGVTNDIVIDELLNFDFVYQLQCPDRDLS